MPPLNEQDRQNLVAYLDGELDAKTSLDLETKLNLDSTARAEVEALRQAWSMLDYLPKAEPSATFTHRTLERLAMQTMAVRRPLPRWRQLAWAAGIILALVTGFATARLVLPAADLPEVDEHLARHLRAVDKVRIYEQADDLNFLRELDQPDLFGDEPGS